MDISHLCNFMSSQVYMDFCCHWEKRSRLNYMQLYVLSHIFLVVNSQVHNFTPSIKITYKTHD